MQVMNLFRFRKGDWVGICAGFVIAIGMLAGAPIVYADYCERPGTCQEVADRTIVPQIQATERTILNRISAMEGRLVEALDAHVRLTLKGTASSQRSLQQQMAQGAMAQVQAQAAMQTFVQQEGIEDNLRSIKSAMVQPITTCLTMVSGAEMPRASETISTAATARADNQTKRQMRVKSISETRLSTYSEVKDKFCSDADVDRGTCETAAVPELQDGDIRSVFLFGGGDGSLTRNSNQEEATTYLISRLTGEGETPAALGDPIAEKTDAGRVYEESRRDYLAVSSLAAYSLQSIRSNHSPIEGLGVSLKQAGITDENVPDSISHAEAVDLVVKASLSPSSVKDISAASNSETLLRKMVTNGTFGLWSSVQTFKSLERQEALVAAQLALNNNSIKRPQLDVLARTAVQQSKD